MVLPDGRRTWPDVDARGARDPRCDEIEAAQRSQDHVEVRYARESPLRRAEEAAATARVHEALGHAFRLTFRGQDAIVRQPNGKYPTFLNSLDDQR